ncbi:unnamed protein product [Rotaria sp. Silwood2]|nr:unnamed protein product [Rotaria sp. Silwood2]CAF2573355.1 unnamed protein product [Rotaria sp. Silwood2]CAF4059472.1 unnamed protein product [Rotaria sp. Silwood2]CAF4148139.1 unnamed protein product [Rotaria sp. Silwood2]
MNQNSAFAPTDSDDQSVQSSDRRNVRRGSSHSPQPDISSHMDNSESSARGERSRRIQRSSSSSSTSSTERSRDRKLGDRVEGPAVVTSQAQQQAPPVQQSPPQQQQYIPEAGKVPVGTTVVSHGGFTGGAQVINGGSFGTIGGGERRKGRFRQEYIRLPDQHQGHVRQVRHRLPTPEPDTIERVYVQRTAAEIIEEITEIPTTPPPIVKERNVVEPAGPPQVVKRTIRVPPRGGAYGGHFQQESANVHYSDNLLSAGGYKNTQQVASSYQQPEATNYSSGYGAAATTASPNSTMGSGFGSVGSGFGSVGSGFGSVGGGFGSAGGFGSFGGFGSAGSGYQQQAPIMFSVGGSSSQPMPGIGCHPAFCFYI